MSDMTERDGAVVVHGNARFTVISPVCIRMEYHPDGEFIDAPTLFAYNRDAGWEDYEIERDPNSDRHITIQTGELNLSYRAGDKPFSGGNLSCTFANRGEEVTWTPEMRNSRNLGGTLQSLDGRQGSVNLGEGLLSRDGYYCIDDSASHILVDDWIQCRPEDAGLDWYLFAYGTDYRAALRALTEIGGSIPMPRKCLLGSWYSRWHDYSSQEYRDLVDEYDARDYPLDVLVWDMDWHRQDATEGLGWAWTKGWTGFSWNRDLLPDAESLLGEMDERDIAVALNVHPHDGIRSHEDMYEPFMQDLGLDPEEDEVPLFDAGDEDYMDAYFKHGHAPHEEAGVEFWWVDWQQDCLIPYVRSVPGLRHLPWLNELYFRHTSRGNRRGVNFSRWAGWGDHRHPIHFSGDAVSTWDMLAFQVPFTTTAGNVGCFFWSHDMGGFTQCEEPEKYARWLQFGAFSAAMRLHGLGRDRRPWTWAEWAQPSMRKSFEWRSRLMPYTYSAVARSCRDSEPLLRPLYLDYPERDAAYRNPQQYLYGDAFMVAPVVTPGEGGGKVGRQVVHFPEGTWYNWFTGERLEGPGEYLVCADLEEMPLFVRAGTPVPMQPYRRRPTSAPLTELTVRCFPGRPGEPREFVLYEDDGETREYADGKFAETTIRYERSVDGLITVTVEPVEGSYPDMPETRDIRLELACVENGRNVRVDGDEAECVFDEDALTTVVEVPEVAVIEGTTIELHADEVDETTARERAIARRRRALQLGDEDTSVETELALRGVGVVHKDESYYRDGADPVQKFYAPPGVLDKDQATLELLRGDDPVASMEYRGKAGYPFAIPVPENLRDEELRVRVHACIDGEEVVYTTKGWHV